MRPQGEIRTVILNTLREQGPMTMRDIAERTQVGYEACRKTLTRAVQSESLAIVGHEKREHCKKWVAIYDVNQSEDEITHVQDSGLVVLCTAIGSWR